MSSNTLWCRFGLSQTALTWSCSAIRTLFASSSIRSVESFVMRKPGRLPINSSAAEAMWCCFPSFDPCPSYVQLRSRPRIGMDPPNSGKARSSTSVIRRVWGEKVTIAMAMPAAWVSRMRRANMGRMWETSSSVVPSHLPPVWTSMVVRSKSRAKKFILSSSSLDTALRHFSIICRSESEISLSGRGLPPPSFGFPSMCLSITVNFSLGRWVGSSIVGGAIGFRVIATGRSSR
mmetsp:Transcript_20496/g.41019  ORF Transcript_20496/g.41019 Transcript_20496/m.41019 type:complete len:233 (+) Transcript_20496:244-942(+)